MKHYKLSETEFKIYIAMLKKIKGYNNVVTQTDLVKTSGVPRSTVGRVINNVYLKEKQLKQG